jgi:hypothetical protein
VHRITARIAFPIAAALACACVPETSWQLGVTVTIPPTAQADYADSLPATVVIASEQLNDENQSTMAGTFAPREIAPRKIGLLCATSPGAQVFRTTLNESGCRVETRVRAWLQSERHDWIGLTNGATTGASCGPVERAQVGIIEPSAAPGADAPQAEGLAFSGQHTPNCDGEPGSVSLVLATPEE